MLGRIAIIPSYLDVNGTLTCIENGAVIPFPVERLFYITDVSAKATRGNHASANAKFAFVTLNGQVEIRLNDGYEFQSFIFRDKTEILIIESMTWIVAENFSKSAVLLVMSDKNYKDCNYISDYTEFEKRVKGCGK